MSPPVAKIHRWTEPGLGSVNTYWIETSAKVIVIDGQRELSKTRRILEDIKATGKPIAAVFLTHPHPDHFGGIGVFAPKGSEIPVYGSSQTRESIAQDRFGLVKASHEVVKDDFPAQVTLPDHDLQDGQEILIDGVRIIANELGEGEAECMTGLYLPDHRVLFCADAIQNGMTAFLLEGRSAAWLQQLENMTARFPNLDFLYPGHGEPGSPPALIVRQTQYLKTFRELVQAEMRAGELTPRADQRVADAMNARYPGYVPVAAIPDLLTKDIEPLANELAKHLNGKVAS